MAQLSSPTLERLIKEARIFLRQQSSSNSTWSDEELTLYINDAIRIYFLEVAERAEGQFDAVLDLDITSGTEAIPLPSNFFEAKALYKRAENNYYILPYENFITTSYTTDGGSNGSTFMPAYYFRGNNIILRPVPQFTESASLRLEYTAFPETLIWGGDTMSSGVSPIFKELIIMYAAYKAKASDSATNGTSSGHEVVATLLGDLYAKFKETVGYRSKYPVAIKPFTP